MNPTPTLPRLDDDDVAELEGLLLDLARIPRARYVVPGRLVDGAPTVVARTAEHAWEAPSGTRALELLDQLTTSATRQARIGKANGKSGTPAHTAPVPYSADPLDLLGQLLGALVSWAHRTHETNLAEWEHLAKVLADTGRADRTPPAPAAPEDLTGHGSAAYLLRNLAILTRRPGSSRPELDTLRRLVRRARSLVDRPADRWYAGPCATPLRDAEGDLVIVDGGQAYCEADLYAKPGATVVVCRSCTAQHRVEARRAELLRLARDRELRAVDVSRALTSLGTPCGADRIRQWKARRRLLVASLDAEGVPLYRVGDVMDLLEADAHRRHKRAQAS